MIDAIDRILAAIGLSLCSWAALAEAPVVDDSENFALFEQQAGHHQPVARSADHHADRIARLDETPLAHDDTAPVYTSNNQTELLNKLQGLQQDVQELRGQLDVQAHEITTLKQQQLDFYKDLDARMRPSPAPSAQIIPPSSVAPATPTASSAAITITPTPHHANPANEQVSYLAAYELINNKQFDEALPAMQAFVAQYPQGGYSANAHYWIGELYMVKKNYPEAITHFERVLQQFPSSSKSSASMLKIGYALAAAGKRAEAQQRLQLVIKQYPDTHAAQLAMAKLESIGAQ